MPVGLTDDSDLKAFVKLAKQYSTKDSGRFVNGLLARIAEDVRPEDADKEE